MIVRIYNDKVYLTLNEKVLIMLESTLSNIERLMALKRKCIAKSKELKKTVGELAISDLLN